MSAEKVKAEVKFEWFNKYYKLLFLIPFILLISSLIYLYSFNHATGDVMRKDVTLTGGTTLTVSVSNPVNVEDIESSLSSKFGGVTVRVLTDLRTGKQIAFSVESKAEVIELKKGVEDYLGYKLAEGDYTAEYTGSSLSESFYKELVRAMFIAFVLMAIVVFVMFRVPIPSLAVIFAAFTDIVVTIAVVDIIGLKISTAGIAAFLMLIGYSVDTDILLTTRVLKRQEKTVNERIFDSFKTGITMTTTSFIAVFISYLIVLSSVLKEVFLIISIGLAVDSISTWLGNTALIKWYCDKKGII